VCRRETHGEKREKRAKRDDDDDDDDEYIEDAQRCSPLRERIKSSVDIFFSSETTRRKSRGRERDARACRNAHRKARRRKARKRKGSGKVFYLSDEKEMKKTTRTMLFREGVKQPRRVSASESDCTRNGSGTKTKTKTTRRIRLCSGHFSRDGGNEIIQPGAATLRRRTVRRRRRRRR
jgi:hypothetical protein